MLVTVSCAYDSQAQQSPAGSPHGDAPADSVAANSTHRPLPVPDTLFGIYGSNGDAASWEDVVSVASTAAVVLVGESHDDLLAHRLQQRLLEDLFAVRRGALVLSLEAFERDVQIVLDEYLSDLITDEHFRKASRPWANYESGYASLVEFSKAHRLPVRASNAPRRYVNRVARLGSSALEDLPVTARNWLAPLPLSDPSPAYRNKWKLWLAEAMQEVTAEEGGDSGVEGAHAAQADNAAVVHDKADAAGVAGRASDSAASSTVSASSALSDSMPEGHEDTTRVHGVHGARGSFATQAEDRAPADSASSPHPPLVHDRPDAASATPRPASGSGSVEDEDVGAGHGAAAFMLDAQTTWDATMAYSIAEALERYPGRTVIHVVGGFHVSGGLGIPEHLQRYAPGTAALVVLMEPVAEPSVFDVMEFEGVADFVILTKKEVSAGGR